LNGRYHASLLQGGYSEFCALAGPVVLHAVLADAQKLHTGKQGAGQSWTFQSGKTLFLKVQEPGRLAEMAAEQAQRELTGTAQQIHTISRSPVVQDCQAPAPVLARAPEPIPAARPVAAKPPTPKPPVPRLYALESDALFEFGKSELRANSYNAIEIMAQRLKRDFSGVERIRVVGHTDAIGQPKSNAKLSLERAKVVAQQLQERGLKPSKGFKIEGEGSTHLVKLRCGNKPTPENKLCHAPNRRVDIVVTGASR
jgi:outer membrane protein OmpA-like peptidoglycan-associated protein